MFARASRQLLTNHSPPGHTWLPFLYNTNTIRGHFYAQEHFQSPYKEQHLPFDNVEEPAADKEDITPEHDDNSTVTPAERQAFETLLKMPRRDADKKLSKQRRPEQPSKADELEAILSSAATRTPRSTQPSRPFPGTLQSLVDETAEQRARARARQLEQRELGRGRAYREDALLRAIDRDFATVATKLMRATTDTEVWQILQQDVFDRVRTLGLDAPAPVAVRSGKGQRKKGKKQEVEEITPVVEVVVEPEQQQQSKATNTTNPPEISFDPLHNPSLDHTQHQTTPTDLQILTTTLPRHLIRIQLQLNTLFTGSPYKLALLPSLRSLGPGAFALGASTSLYNQHMRAMWQAHEGAGLAMISATLAEMEREVFAFDEHTHALLRRIVAHASVARKGKLGEAMRMLWGTERLVREVEVLHGWVRVVSQRRQEDALNAAAAAQAEVVQGHAEAEGLEGYEAEAGVEMDGDEDEHTIRKAVGHD